MSSLRPLATIALLAAVGVFLYMKINETEPQLSQELEEWSTSELEVGAGDGLAAAAPGASTTAPPLGGSDAPPFSAASAPAPPVSAPPGDVAPAWTPTPPPAATKSEVDSSPVARTADPASATIPAMPPLPGIGAVSSPAATETGPGDSDGAPSAADNVADNATPTPPAVDGVPPSFDATAATAKPSMFPQARVAAQSAVDRGDLGQALTLLSDWHGDPSLTPAEATELNALLSQLAGSVIYEGPPAHRLEPPYIAKAGESLESVADKYDVPWPLLAKINGLAGAGPLQPGKELKVVRGPFSALIDLSERKMTLMLDRRYAGQFALEFEPTFSVEEGQWKVDSKPMTPGGGGIYGAAETEDRSVLLANLANPTGPTAVLRGPGNADPMSAEPRGRVLRLKANDIEDVYDILSVGSRITIRK